MDIVVFYNKKTPSSLQLIGILKQRNYNVKTIEVDSNDKNILEIIKQYQIEKIPTILTSTEKFSGKECQKFIRQAKPIISNNFNSKLNQNQVNLDEDFRIDTPNEYNERIGNSSILNPYGLLGQKLTNLQEDLSSFSKNDALEDRLSRLQQERQD